MDSSSFAYLLLALISSLLIQRTVARSNKSVALETKCSLSIEVELPSDDKEEPSVTCFRYCLPKSTKSWFEGKVVHRNEALEAAYGLMVEVLYLGDSSISCWLRPLISDASASDSAQHPAYCSSTCVPPSPP